MVVVELWCWNCGGGGIVVVLELWWWSCGGAGIVVVVDNYCV